MTCVAPLSNDEPSSCRAEWSRSFWVCLHGLTPAHVSTLRFVLP